MRLLRLKTLLHICCAPCLIYPLELLNEKDMDVTGFFYNNNIHPFTEFEKRMDTLKEYSDDMALPVIYDETYDIKTFLRKIAFHEDKKCEICYTMRLKNTAKFAAQGGFEAFSSTLLYSKYQNHELIKKIGTDLSDEHGIDFYYDDFRVGWGRGLKKSRKLNMYRQRYCGCIYSERDRYLKKEISAYE
jgi:predicted adenine nucleotide alpha hydrolase (AANH) superfamily ATPase